MTDSNSKPPFEEDEIPEIELPDRPMIPEPPKAHFEPPPERRPQPPQTSAAMRTIGLAATIGVMLVMPVVLGAVAGMWLDNCFKTSPVFTLALVLLGIITGFVQMIRILQRIEQEEKHP